MPDIQSAVQRVLDKVVADGLETCIQAAAYHEGRLIVDAWAAPQGKKIDGLTLFPVYSTGKGIAATAIHMLVERGVLDWDAPIARYWPEFEACGKGGITLRHALEHTAGMAQMPDVDSMEDLQDWDGMCRRIAAMAPTNPPGAHARYHAITYTWLLGEPAHRADGRDFNRIIQEDICRPLGITELYFGIPDSVESRVVAAEAVPPQGPPASSAPDIIGARVVPPAVMPLEALMNNPKVRRACVPASNGIMNARSIARHYAALVGNGVDGVKLLKENTIDAATRGSKLLGASWGLGYGLQGPEDNRGAVFGHGGYGGASGFADRRMKLAVGVAKSRMSGGAAVEQIVNEIRKCLA